MLLALVALHRMRGPGIGDPRLTDPLADVLGEARRLSAALDRAAIRARLLGGCGIALCAHRPIPSSLSRAYGDIDFVVRRADQASFRELIESNGYEPDVRFNNRNGHHRLLHFDKANGRQLDTFVGEFRMCHALDLDDQLPLDGLSLAPADLLLTKLQVLEINDKDLRDTVLLLLDHPVAASDPDAIDRERLATILGKDWGWFTTVTDNLEHLAGLVRALNPFDDGLRAVAVSRIDEVRSVAEQAPKSLKWRGRAKIGRRVAWYDLPEEVTGA